jgi:ribonucleoside-diphosphate reductase beta chain
MNKYCIFPIRDFEVWNAYKKQFGLFWTVEEIDFSQDYRHFQNLPDNIKHIIKMILIFFSNSDGLVNYNISKNFLEMDKEIVFNYVFQMLMEQIHNETYSMMIETLISDNDEKEKIFDSLNHYQIIIQFKVSCAISATFIHASYKLWI